MVARERVPVEQDNVQVGDGGWTSRGTAVVARERVPVEQVDAS